MKEILKDLSNAIANGSALQDDPCKNIEEKDDAADGPNKRACQYIVKGLKHIYGIEGNPQGTAHPDHKKNDKIFEQTMACLILNEYGKLLGEKSCIDEKTIVQAFTAAAKLHTTECKSAENKCNQCNWDKCTNLKSGKGDTQRQKIKDELEKNEDIQKTFTTIHNSSSLCNRVQCVWKKWFPNRGMQETNTTYIGIFWDKDVNNQLKNLSGGMLKQKPDVDKECNSIPGLDNRNKEACKLIIAGLKHIYEIERGTLQPEKKDDEKEKRKIDDNLIFHRTASCVLLNVFADRMIDQTKGQLCPITEEEIKKMFDNGNTQRDNWCKGKNANGGKMECEVCERVPNISCEIGNKKEYNVKNKMDEMFSDKGKNVEAQNVLTTVNSINNALCNRANCVTINWFKDRKISDRDKQDWCTYWDTDFKKRLMELSKDMTNNSKTMGDVCKGIKEGSSTNPQAEEKACQFIVRGLEHIYKINKCKVTEKDPTKIEKEEKKAVHNVQFEQVMKCILLNEYANKITQKCPAVQEDKISEMFEKGNAMMVEWCKDKGPNGKSDCVPCERDKNYKDCTLNVDNDLWNKKQINGKVCEEDKGNLMKKVEELFQNNDANIEKAMKAATDICTTPPSLQPRARSEGDQEPASPPEPGPPDAAGPQSPGSSGPGAQQPQAPHSPGKNKKKKN
ncbi:SICA antigen [Plasmodium coatneyi]|uniref:SICA antigen n=1 Tax=Plasmodium coatneyi TaxID=208452 RepID=A0A1B1E2I2_9APIC|nr:SICA antigen [Plasmodium coatneyi]ANQ09135.1 SICA antigen [Plasmodium coatneyi]